MLRSLVKPPLRFVARGIRGTAKYILGRRQRREGLPTGLSSEIVEALCREHGRGGVKHCTHTHLSGWKSLGTYRLELLTDDGGSWRLIFKNEDYSPQLIAALEGLPAAPGPPEAAIYGIHGAPISVSVPKLFWLHEVKPGCHFQYLLEDLTESCERPRDTLPDTILAIRGLLQIHEALRETFAAKHPSGLIVYDRQYSEQLFEYAARSLTDYAARTADRAVAAVRERWSEIAFAHQRDEFYESSLRSPIHGDCSRSHMHIFRRNEAQLKMVDWEWAGIGLPHADLAALLRSVRRENRSACLQAFAQEDERLDAQQHQRILEWCQLERRLLDAAFLARQQLVSSRRVPWLRYEISRSAEDVLSAVEAISAGQIRAAA